MFRSNIISESAILQEAEVIKTKPNKAVFRMVMQTADEINKNKRYYPLSVLKEAMTEFEEECISKGQSLCEMDHPLPTGDYNVDMIRQTQVMIGNVASIIRDYEFRGTKLIGELETLSNRKGIDLKNLLLDKVGIGLSMRGLAEIEKSGNINTVVSPLHIICYDHVLRPSHQASVVSFNDVQFMESLDIIEKTKCKNKTRKINNIIESSNFICTSDGMCYLPNYFDKLVEKKIIKFLDRMV